MSLRSVVSALMTAALAVLVAACGVEDEKGGGGGNLSGSTVTMVGYGGETQRAQEQAFADPFASRTGARVVQDSPTSYSKIEAMQEADNVKWDVVASEPFVTAGSCGKDKTWQPLKKVDRSQIDKRFLTDDCSVPAGVYSINLVYDKKKFGDDPPTDWSAFFDTAKYPGKRALWSYVGGNPVEIGLLGDGVPADQLYPLDVDRGFQKLESIKGDLTYYSDLAQSIEMLLNGQVSMVATTNARAYVLSTIAPDKYGVVWNDALLAWDAWSIPNGTPNTEAAEGLLGTIATPKAQSKLAELYPIGPATKNPDFSSVDPEIKSFIPTTPEHLNQAVVVDSKWYARNFDDVNERYTTFQSG